MDPSFLDLDTSVGKIGRTTRYTQGSIAAVGLDGIPITSSTIGTMLFDDVIEVTWSSARKPFSQPGDSGSLVYATTDRSAIGLIFAGGRIESTGKKIGVSYVCRLSSALEDFGAVLLD